MRKKVIPYLIVVGLIVLIVVGALGVRILQRYIPTKEKADIGQLLGVERRQPYTLTMNCRR